MTVVNIITNHKENEPRESGGSAEIAVSVDAKNEPFTGLRAFFGRNDADWRGILQHDAHEYHSEIVHHHRSKTRYNRWQIHASKCKSPKIDSS